MSEENSIPFFYGALVIGPSGSGKTTFCRGVAQMLKGFNRPFILVNLDPANVIGLNNTKYQINIKDLIDLDEVMQELSLGPNAALVYCMNFLEQNLSWLEDELLEFKDHYIIMDFPGQIELYLNNDSLLKMIKRLTDPKNQKICSSLVAVEMFDALNIYDESQYLSQCMMSLVSMINLEIPHMSVFVQCNLEILSKIDLLKNFGAPPYSLQFYFEATELSDYFAREPEDKFQEKYQGFTNRICELIDSQKKVSFIPLHIEDKELLTRIVLTMDISNGYYFLDHKDEVYSLLVQAFENESQQIITTDTLLRLEGELFPEEDDL